MADLGFAHAGIADSMRRHLHHSDTVLDGTNYLLWKLTLRRILDGLRLLGHAEGSTMPPVAPYLPDVSDSSVADEDAPPSLSPVLLDAFEKKLEKWHADDSSAKMVICQTVTPGIRSQIADLPTAHAMWAYLARRYCVSSQAQIYTLYQALSGLQQGDESVDQFYSRFCELWRQVDALSPPECPTHAVAPTTTCAPCARRSRHEESRRLYDFLMRLRPEFESCRAQLLHSPTAHTLDEAFALVLAEETRLRASSTGAGAALATQRFAPPTSGP